MKAPRLIRARRFARSQPLEEVVGRYRATLARLDEFRGDPRRWNRLVDEAQIYHLRLRETAEGRTAIERLLDDDNAEVRRWAASHALLWSPATAKPVIEAIRDDPSAPWEGRASAEMTLKLFESGELSHDWGP
jgi:hypothetical protein